uniref:glycerol kinase n=1 Tax=Dunaliella viridis TaxID=140095 RepID=D2SPD9_9CHLO|nr:hypothetical protein [Dunaliella viridis]
MDMACSDFFRAITGLPIHSYFPAFKIKWLYENVEAVRNAVDQDQALFGTLDSWLIYKLTGGKDGGIHITDVPGQRSHVGDAKNTYGTGAFMLLNTGTEPILSTHGLITTVHYRLGPSHPTIYALEDDVLGLYVLQVPESGGVYFVPAFSGLFAPRWDSTARGVILGLTEETSRPHIVRAMIEAICYQSREADILQMPVIRPTWSETTVLGAAVAAGLGSGFWSEEDVFEHHGFSTTIFTPEITPEEADEQFESWMQAVTRTHNSTSAPSPAAKQFVQQAIAEHKCVVFSKTHCPFCAKAKSALKQFTSQFTVIELDARPDGDEIQDVLKEMTGGRSVPRVFIGGKFIGGGDDTLSQLRQRTPASQQAE